MAIYLFKGKSKLERSHIGQIIMSTTLNTQAKVIEQYGGISWTKIEGRFLLGASSDYPVNATGGEATHKLTVNEIPKHYHDFIGGYSFAWGKGGLNDPVNITGALANAGDPPSNDLVTSQNTWNKTETKGGGQSHNNMPPYKAVYIWERTA